MKLRDLERHLLEHGARRAGEGANHTKWRGPRGAASVVPRHREIDFRLIRKICRDLGNDEQPHPA
ncbi:MAG: type II toxin-antitoxin system HicA family toxin [Solirubrobacteraceae bacterium]